MRRPTIRRDLVQNALQAVGTRRFYDQALELELPELEDITLKLARKGTDEENLKGLLMSQRNTEYVDQWQDMLFNKLVLLSQNREVISNVPLTYSDVRAYITMAKENYKQKMIDCAPKLFF